MLIYNVHYDHCDGEQAQKDEECPTTPGLREWTIFAHHQMLKVHGLRFFRIVAHGTQLFCGIAFLDNGSEDKKGYRSHKKTNDDDRKEMAVLLNDCGIGHTIG